MVELTFYSALGALRVPDVTYREVETKSALNAGKGMSFELSLNPYLGCAHACTSCFARAYQERFRERNVGSDFDSNVEVRLNIADVLRREPRRPWDGALAIGTATDPYQPIEGRHRLTRRCLEALVDRPMPTSIVTKGPLVVRDIDVLQELALRTDVVVYFSVPCVDLDVVRTTDPSTAPPRQRLRALSMLRAARPSPTTRRCDTFVPWRMPIRTCSRSPLVSFVQTRAEDRLERRIARG